MPAQPHTSGTNAAHGARGFTATELLVVIAIVTVIAAIAMPTFAEFTVKQRMRIAVYDLITDITYARGEAVKRNARVTISRVGSSWAGGWTIDDVNGNRLRAHPSLSTTVTESTGPATVTFGLDGRQVGSSNATFTFDDSTAKTSIPVRRVVLDASGKPKSI